jgi:hypothetical protein
MKTQFPSNIVALMLALLLNVALEPSTCFGQGSLTPPGAPAPTMKTLQQIEPRTPISSLPVFIGQPGSYYLTGSFDVGAGQDGIVVSANNVTIDLNGFTIRSFDPTNGNVGIRLDVPVFSHFDNITILNGHIVGYSLVYSGGGYSGSGFGYGIYAPDVNDLSTARNSRNVRVSGVTVSGCRFDGIHIGHVDTTTFNDLSRSVISTTVESCEVSTVGGNGIYANTVSRCAAYQCGMNGVYANTASECYGDAAGSYDGIYALAAHNCHGRGVGGAGVSALSADNCFGIIPLSESGGGVGVNAGVANNCSGYNYSIGTGGVGLSATTANNCYGYNDSNGPGLWGAVANNSWGQSNGNGLGLNALIAHDCYGSSNGSGTGVEASEIATGCYGVSSSGIGLRCNTSHGAAMACYGQSSTYVGLNSYIANSCVAVGLPPFSLSFKYNMP